MSSGGQLAGGLIGGIAGAFIGGPAGAYQGAALGMAIGGALDPPKGPSREGPRLNDLSIQTSTYGAVIPRIYGTVGGMNGNIFWLENNKLKEVATETEEGGKGGGSTSEVTTYSYFATASIGICEGEIGGIRRIWAGTNLIYDAGSSDLESIKQSNRQIEGFDVYTGSETQNANSRMQADLGVGNVSAYRGFSYVVIKDFPVEIYGNAMPPFKFEVVGIDGQTEEIIQQSQQFQEGGVTKIPVSNPFYRGGYASASADHIRVLLSSDSETKYPNNAQFNSTNAPLISLYSQSKNAGIITTFFSFGEIRFYLLDDISSSSPSYTRLLTTAISANTNFIISAHMNGASYTGLVVDPSDSSNKIIEYGTMAGSGLPYNNAYMGFSLSDKGYGNSWAMTRDDDYIYLLLESTPEIAITEPNGDLVGYIQTPELTNRGKQRCSMRRFSDRISILTQETESNIRLLSYDLSGNKLDDFTFQSNVTGSPLFLDTTIRGWWLDLGVFYVDLYQGTPDRLVTTFVYNLYSLPKSDIPLSVVVSNESERTGILKPSDYDASELTETVDGYRITKVGGIREGIVPLQGAYPFDTYQSGYIVKYAKRGRDPVATIDIGDLGVNEQLKQARDMDTQLPRKVVVKYLDAGRDYDTNDQYSERINTDAVNTRTIDMPIVLGATKAAQIVESLIYLYWLERTDFGPFTLPPTYNYLEPADVITLNAQYATYELRLLTVDYKSDGSLSCSGRLNNPSVYQSDAVSDDADSDQTIDGTGVTLDFLVDAPMVDETKQNKPGFGVAMSSYSSGWPGGLLFRSGDDGQSWQDLQAFTRKGVMGNAANELTEHAGDIFEAGSSLTIYLYSGELSSISQDAQLTGGNIAAYGVDGRWEIISFRTATLESDGSYTLTNFMRGLRGTEWATGLHEYGDRFVMMQAIGNQFVGVQSELIGVDRLYRSVTSGDTITSAENEEFTYQGVNLKPLSGVDANGRRDLAGDLAGTWYARTRVSSSWWTNGIPGPTGESSEAYEVDIMNGSTVVRTLNTVTPEFLYTAADQVTDFGSVQSSIYVKIYQMSETVGRGFVYEVTL